MDKTLLIFTYAPAGLGHLRVTDALYHGLPKGIEPVLLGSHDTRLTALHRITSLNTGLRRVMEWIQQGRGEYAFAPIYRSYLKRHADGLFKQMTVLIDQQYHRPEQILVISTHFSLTHQLAYIKERLEKEQGLKMFIVMQVTDDSPQTIWYVPGADLTVVPSHFTKKALLAYGRKTGLPAIRIEVAPYPVSPILTHEIASSQYAKRLRQLDPDSASKIHIAVPVSGAAVGLSYSTMLINALRRHSDRYLFHIVSKRAPFTESFLHTMQRRPYVHISSGDTDHAVVHAYEELYQKESISLEITKPSEQAFKALITPKQVGGSLLLFSHPVGRQEYDNLNFLRSHRLLPHTEDTVSLWNRAKGNTTEQHDILAQVKRYAHHFRGVKLPDDPEEAAYFIHWCLEEYLFAKMAHFRHFEKKTLEHADELGSDGVSRFWQIVSEEFSRTR